ncbi:cytotoxic translational repressor of toxin-antitoxin stability system [Phormidesmis sp. 146-33]
MNTIKPSSIGGLMLPARLEVRYDRTFLIDLKSLESSAFPRIQQFVFGEFFQMGQLQDLCEFQPVGSSEIFYRFTLDKYLICIEITGQIIKFLRVLPKPDV